MFDDNFINELPEEPILAIKEICDTFFSFHSNYSGNAAQRIKQYDNYLKVYSLYHAFVDHYNIENSISDVLFDNNLDLSITRSLSDLSDPFNANV